MIANLDKIWYRQNNIIPLILWPFSLLYRFIISIRHLFYCYGIFKSYRAGAPVIVVGNITVGGTGKTPLVITLIDLLKKQGLRPGVATRGYRGKSQTWPLVVTAQSDPYLAGDEPVLLAIHTGVPVIAGANRAMSSEKLIRDFQCNVIVSDDGLQHYALHRDMEIVVLDGSRHFGNGFCLPAGPLREPIKRLKTVDLVIVNGDALAHEYGMQFKWINLVNIRDHHQTKSFSECTDKKIIAITGIGNPDRFFNQLCATGLSFSTRVFPDHHFFKSIDFEGITDEMVIMTEKDAIKCGDFATDQFWFVKGCAQLNDDTAVVLSQLLNGLSLR